jgi:hypothetical protein
MILTSALHIAVPRTGANEMHAFILPIALAMLSITAMLVTVSPIVRAVAGAFKLLPF